MQTLVSDPSNPIFQPVPYLKQTTKCMRRLDQLNWTCGFRFQSLGAKIGVRTDDESVLEELWSITPPCSELIEDTSVDLDDLISVKVGGKDPETGAKKYHLVYGNIDRFARTHNWEDAMHAYESTLQLETALYARHYTIVHAGVVGWNDKAIVIPARSFSGKSELTRALLKAGADFYSDEFAVLDPEGWVHPYPRKLAIRQQPGEPRLRLTAEDLGSRTATEPIRIGTVLVTKYREGATWRPRKMNTTQTAMALFDNTGAARFKPAECLQTIYHSVKNVQGIKSLRGDARQTAELILDQYC